jgi:uncharacterized Rossmann fold enzyme
MEFDKWEPSYLQILDNFKFKREDDEISARLLTELLEKSEASREPVSLDDLDALLRDKTVYIFGEGPTLADDIAEFKGKGTIISADGATTALMKQNILPDIIVTDLDGRIEDQVQAVEKGSIVLIHAHGDNQSNLEKWVPIFKGKVLGTTQAEPIPGLNNFGGFTDGDRAVYLADHFQASRIELIAFDFLNVGDHTKKEDMELKLRKLTWANLLIGILENPDIHFV